MNERESVPSTAQQKRFDKLLGILALSIGKEDTDSFMGTHTLPSGIRFFSPEETSPYSPSIGYGKEYTRRTNLAEDAEERRFHMAMLSLIELEKVVGNSNLRPTDEAK